MINLSAQVHIVHWLLRAYDVAVGAAALEIHVITTWGKLAIRCSCSDDNPCEEGTQFPGPCGGHVCDGSEVVAKFRVRTAPAARAGRRARGRAWYEVRTRERSPVDNSELQMR